MNSHYQKSFSDRVNYAARVMLRGGDTNRRFDGCFEEFDGDFVVAALARRAQSNHRLAAAMPRYLAAESVSRLGEVYKNATAKQLRDWAAEARAKVKGGTP